MGKMMHAPAKRISVRLVIIVVLCSCQAPGAKLSCDIEDIGIEFDVERSAGVWYEVVRIPDADVPACVNVTAPATCVDGNYTLQMDYINNANNQWHPMREYLVFPCNSATQNGVFELDYSSDDVRLIITFKLIQIQYDLLAVVCGSSSLSASTSLLKVLTRQRDLNATIIAQINNIANQYDLGSEITFVEQSNCNGAASHLPALTYFLTLLFSIFAFIRKLFFQLE